MADRWDLPLPEVDHLDAGEQRGLVEEAVRQGDAIQRFLEDEDVQAVLNLIEQRLVDRWKGTALGEREQREAAYHLWYALAEVREGLRSVAEGGRLAKRRLDELDRESGPPERSE